MGQGPLGRVAINLARVEHPSRAREQDGSRVVGFLSFGAFAFDHLVEDDRRAFLALADHRAVGLPLLERRPFAGSVGALLRREPQGQYIDPAIGFGCRGVDGRPHRGSVAPRHLERAGAALDRCNDACGDVGVNVVSLLAYC